MSLNSYAVADIYAILKARLSDPNKNLTTQAVEICGNLAKSMGKPFERHARILLGPMMSVLTDPKPQVRATALEALDKVCEAIMLASIISTCASSLMSDHSQLRKDLLTWMSGKMSSCNSGLDYQCLIQPVFLCLQDRNTDVRRAGQDVFGFMGDALGADVLREKAAD